MRTAHVALFHVLLVLPRRLRAADRVRREGGGNNVVLQAFVRWIF